VLIAQVRRTIEERALIPRGSRVLCACSGGPDSAALLFTLARLGPELSFELEAASVDHGLRADAARDVAIAAEQCAVVGVRFHALQVAVDRRPSLQAQARAARYAALLRLASERSAARVAVGHTRDDQAETVLLRLIRGTGLHGLGAIDPNRQDGVIRPLIDCDRADVHQLAREQFREIADDASNSDLRFERVRIRAHVMPLLIAENPQLVRHLGALADEAREYRAPLEDAARALLDEAAVGLEPGSLRIAALAERPALLRREALRTWLQARGATPVSRAHVEELDHALRVRRGHVWLANGFSARVNGDGLVRVTPPSPLPPAKPQAGEP
jgi:tRNA(Ile)-lysidine synthase